MLVIPYNEGESMTNHANLTQETSKAQDLSLETMCSIVNALAAAKSKQNIEEALKVYHPNCVLDSPSFGSKFEGEEQIRKALVNFFSFAPDYEVDLPHMAADGDTLCGWGTVKFTPAFTYAGEKPNGRRIATPVFILFRFKDHRVSWESFHFDLADVARQAGVAPDSLRRR